MSSLLHLMEEIISRQQPVTTEESLQGRANAFAALRHRNFQLYFAGQLVSNAGTWMQVIAQGWLVYQIGHSELALGAVGFASAIPSLVATPWGGVVVDRVPKRTLLILTQTGAMLLAFVLAALVFSGLVQQWHIILLAAGLGLVNSFDSPARQAFVVEMVGREDLPNAIALNSLMFNSARVVGPALGGLLLAVVGAGWCFTINGISFLAVIWSLWAMELHPEGAKVTAESPWKQFVSRDPARVGAGGIGRFDPDLADLQHLCDLLYPTAAGVRAGGIEAGRGRLRLGDSGLWERSGGGRSDHREAAATRLAR